ATVPARAAGPALRGRRAAEVCVVGGGFAGLNTALGLAERGVRDVVLLEAEQVGFGASGRNGGFVFGGFSRGEEALLRELGEARARALYAGSIDAVERIRHRIDEHAIDCERVEAGVVWANWFRDPRVLRERQELLARHYGVDWQWLPQAELRERIRTTRYHDGLYEPRAFHFHPLKYARGLAAVVAGQGVAVHEQSPAIGLERAGGGWRVRTPEGEVAARSVVLACGGYLARLRRRVDAGVLPIATYVMVTEPLGARLHEVLATGAAVYDTRFAFDYYRPLPDTRLLWGGRISVLDRSPAAVERLLRRDLLKVFPRLDGVRIDYAWSGLMSYARHQMPQVGEIEPGLWLAQAFGGHGVAPTTFAGELLAAAIAEGDLRWREMADYGLVSAFKPAGFLGAQLGYWWAEARDAWRDRRERSAAGG
ncbi:MAG TPA: FAD-binding oxidoreductase, partial [Xanthomonadaceae bacterium]|nr:FAD-binding oxidoreductase [Xanthomonadaceae bacterium]